MGKRVIAVNAGPRMGWNTETLISEASRGAESAGAVIERFGGTEPGVVPVQGYIANFYVSMAVALLGGLLAVLLTARKKPAAPAN